MKRIISTLFVIAFAAFVASAQQNGVPGPQGGATKASSSKAKVLTRAEFDSLIADPSSVLLIDVRRPDEISSNGGFPVYLNIQIGDLAKSLAWIPKDRTIITVSNHAARGGAAADLLAKNGFKVAGTIGAQVYEQQGGKLTRIAPPPAKPAGAAAAAKE